ncbi:hypothetical protein MHLP_04425 [Candidatus Mycoplasma haematolamae str. Purdue]|uniref:Uncharacterized protein n=1 Tax=Mycoplasma haematolamae (strain Purdue) TaxID=1212765 RepID=I7BAZ8_MYCHA|nr:hypothetical protein [Candidatus Mycoplasma haematolamae]AFO52465.1 hypothetical protein MHLP_04425 [Candidatus Mycoplasma haematolamae str. Purdue]
MWFSIHPGIWGAIATLTTGLAVNVVASTAYQAQPVRIDWDNIPESFNSAEGYRGEDPLVKKQYELYRRWGTSVIWYLFTAKCPQESQLSPERKVQCAQHRKDYPDAPEVVNKSDDIATLQAHYNKITARRN